MAAALLAAACAEQQPRVRFGGRTGGRIFRFRRLCYRAPFLCGMGDDGSVLKKLLVGAPKAVLALSPRDQRRLVYVLGMRLVDGHTDAELGSQEALLKLLAAEVQATFRPVPGPLPLERLAAIARLIGRNTPDCFGATAEQLADFWRVYVNVAMGGKLPAGLEDVLDDFQLKLAAFVAMKPLRFKTVTIPRWISSLTVGSRLMKLAKCGRRE